MSVVVEALLGAQRLGCLLCSVRLSRAEFCTLTLTPSPSGHGPSFGLLRHVSGSPGHAAPLAVVPDGVTGSSCSWSQPLSEAPGHPAGAGAVLGFHAAAGALLGLC